MSVREKQILALRTAYISGIFSLIVCLMMLLNYRQLVTTDPLESEVMKIMVERLQEDKSNEDLKTEIRNLDLMARNAYFTNQWQIRSGAFLLIGGIIIMVIALRIYYSLKAKIAMPDSTESSLDIELLISRKWILFTLFFIFGLALVASFLSIDHLSDTYVINEPVPTKEEIPVQQIIPKDEAESSLAEEKAPQIEDVPSNTELVNENVNVAEAQITDTTVAVGTAIALKETSVSDLLNNYPSFRGPFGLGIAHQKNIPTNWDGTSGENIKWKVKTPLSGFNSPVIWEDQVFLTGADQTNQSVYCYNLNNGNMVWEYKVSNIERPAGKAIETTDDTGFAAPSVATDGNHVYAIFATGDLVCVDLKGKRIWAKNMGIPDNHYGHSSSLLLWKNHLFIQFDTNVEGKVLALDALNGNQVWETMRSSKISWASPILVNMGNHYGLEDNTNS